MELDTTALPLQMQIHYFSDISSKRRMNQDNFYICGYSNSFSAPSVADRVNADTQSLQAIALFDGMGGEASGERASLVAAKTMPVFLSSIGDTLLEERIPDAGRTYHFNFLHIIDEYLGDDSSICGTTFVGVFLQNRRMIPVWLGDSRAYLLRDKTLHRLTTDHSLAQSKIDRGLISEEAAKATRDWHVLTGYVGRADAVFSVGAPITLRPGDKIFLCSDGITDYYTDEELLTILSGTSSRAIQTLLNMAQTVADDNCTAIIIDITDNPLYVFFKSISRRISEWQHTYKSKTKK